eukprot:9543055-Lingulodinium_polyedra.AAC.1
MEASTAKTEPSSPDSLIEAKEEESLELQVAQAALESALAAYNAVWRCVAKLAAERDELRRLAFA